MRDSIYTLTLRRRGVLIGSGADLTILRKITAADIPLVPQAGALPDDPVAKLLEMAETYKIVDFVVVDAEGRYFGMVTGEDIRTALLQREAIPLLLVGELMRTDLPTVGPDETLDTILDKFSRHDVWSLAVTSEGTGGAPGKALGLLTRARAMRRYQQALSED
jgi:CIC family chloride channel protein